MTSIPIHDSFGNTVNLKVQPSTDGSGNYVLVLHYEAASSGPENSLQVGSAFNSRAGYRHYIYYPLVKTTPAGTALAQIASLKIVRSSDGSGDFILAAKALNAP